MPAIVLRPVFAPTLDPRDPLQNPCASVRVVGTGYVHRASLRKFRAFAAQEGTPSPLIVHCTVRLDRATLTREAIVCPRCEKDDPNDVTALVMDDGPASPFSEYA